MSDVLSSLSNDLAALVNATGSSVVRVEARRRLPGSGVVWSADGLVVTSHHVVEQDKDIFLGLDNGERVPAEIVGRDPSTDVAVLRVSGVSLTAPTWGSVEDLSVGNLVLALGRPGEKVLATLGIISALNGSWQRRMGPPMWGGGGGRRWGGRGRGGEHRHGHEQHNRGGQIDNYVQTDVVMYPGFSGGPLVGADNKVLGINTSALNRGISMTIPQATIARVVETLVKHGRIRRGFLGVGVQSVELPTAIAEQVEQSTGVLVVSVEPTSPAASAGLVLGDTLINLDGDPVQSVEELLASLGGDRVGTPTNIQVLRAGQLIDVTVTIAERV
jgi:S1-C subfamily serine protease